MKILILAANFIQTPYPVYPLGAGAVTRLCREAGHDTSFLDLLSDSSFGEYNPERLHSRLLEFQPDAVGISIRNLESADSSNADESWSLDLVRRLVSDIKAACKVPVFLGGAGFSLMPDTVLKHTGADYGLPGEGEESLPKFLAELASGSALPGLQVRPAPCGLKHSNAYSPGLVKAYTGQGGLIGVQTKRGCPFKCLYCSYPLLEGRQLRLRPTDDVMADLEQISSMSEGVPHIAFADAVFNDPAGHFRNILAEIIKSGLKIKWTAFFQPAALEKGDFKLFTESGLSGLEFGTDASTDETLAGLQKPFNFALVAKLQKECAEANIPGAHYIIFGGPGETAETVEKGIENIKALPGCVVFISCGLSIYPHTPLYDLAVSEGVIEKGAEILKPLFYFSPHLNPGTLDTRLKAAFRGSPDRLYPPNVSIERTQVLRRMGFKGILWDTLIGLKKRRPRSAASV